MFNTKDERIYAGSKSLLLFWMIYFPHYFKSDCAPFHSDLCDRIDRMNAWEHQYQLDIAFRESAKTSYAKMDFIRNIVYGWSKMMFYICYEDGIAENNLLDIALELQTNQYLIADFGQLYFDQTGQKKSKKSSVSNFLTSNGCRVQASTVKKTLRGQVFAGDRPDYLLLDDIENDITKKSFVKTRTTINFIEEMMSAIAPHAKVHILGNRVTDTWVIADLEERFRENPQANIFEKALIENGEITWARFDWNWINAKRDMLNKNGSKRFEQEYLNQPIVDGNRLFVTDLIDPLIDAAKNAVYTTPPSEDNIFRAKWKIWKEPEFDRYDGPAEYMIGVDISQGFGLDSSCIEILNRKTGEQVAEWESNIADPSSLVDEILWAYEEYNNPIVAPENNSIGQAVISVLKERGMQHILYVEQKIDAITKLKVNRYGWNTNGKTKPKCIFDLKKAVEDEDIIINSVLLLKELRSFTNSDLDYSTFDPETSRHFDRVMAIAICWQMRNYNQWFDITKANDPLAWIEKSAEHITGKSVIENTFIKKRNWHSIV